MSNLGERTKYRADSVVAGEPEVIYTLKRLNDGLTHTGYKVQYVEWNEDETAKESYDDAQVGRSLILDPRFNYTWLTTTITEIVEQREGYIKFATKNSTYELITT
jgi:hypothetical protein